MTYPRIGMSEDTRESARRNTLCPFHRAKVATKPTRTTPGAAGARPLNASRSNFIPDGENRSKSTALYIGTIGKFGNNVLRSAATLFELTTATLQAERDRLKRR